MKGILINVKTNEVTDVTLDPSKRTLDEMYRLIGCEMVEVATDIEHDNVADTVWVDEEGLLSMDNSTRFFTIENGHQPFAGNGLILGANFNNGKSIVTHLTADDVRQKVKFHSLNQVRQMK